ncbi:MAG: leucine--tRNA ligase [Candidatus Binatia bacterium]
MEERYHPQKVEEKWQGIWQAKKSFRVTEDSLLPKYYLLEMFPYPSGRIHMGHVRNYSIGDVIARFKRMRGYNVLHPMGWDAFGLPAENAAIEHGVHPAKWTLENIAYMRDQLKKMGFSYDWTREFATCDPLYYRWEQWIFVKMYKKGLVYRKSGQVNWCEKCLTVLANEQVDQGLCWRCDRPVVLKDLEQWFFRITDYAEELLADLDGLEGWPEKVLTMQRNWIGKSVGAEILFPLVDRQGALNVFTTRQDTVYGATFVSLAVEHPLAVELSRGTPQEGIIKEFVERTKKINQTRRGTEELEKEGLFTGSYCKNPFTQETIPIYVANFVLMEYGAGAVMAVPAHDQRDFEFARKYALPVRVVIQPKGKVLKSDEMAEAYVEDGVMVSSGPFSGLPSEKGREKIVAFLEEKGWGKRDIRYRLRDWGVSRQRYWGTPIPMIHCDACGIVPVPEGDLPVILPTDVEFPEDGRSPLTFLESFLRVDCPQCGKAARRETDTMDTFVDSSWYFLRFTCPDYKELPVDLNSVDRWLPVDQYIGGIEHAIMHLLYARFFTKVMRDLDLFRLDEPFENLLTQGMVRREAFRCPDHGYRSRDGEVDQKGRCTVCGNPVESIGVAAMSKSKKNGVDPDELVVRYGADTARLFALFAAPPEKDLDWSDQGVEGAHRFLSRLWRFIFQNREALLRATPDLHQQGLPPHLRELRRQIHRTIKKVTEDIEGRLHFNTAIAAVMELFNALSLQARDESTLEEGACLVRAGLETIVVLLYPFVPHLASELWENLGQQKSLEEVRWPVYFQEALEEEQLLIVVQVDGRVRGRITVPADASGEFIEAEVLADPKVRGFLQGKAVQRVIQVPRRLVNIVLEG